MKGLRPSWEVHRYPATPHRPLSSHCTKALNPQHAPSMRSRRRQSQRLLHNVINHQLTRDDESHVNDPRPGPREECGQSPPSVHGPHDAEKSSLVLASLVRFREDHVARLGEDASEDGGDEGGADGDDPLEIGGGVALGAGFGEEAVEELGEDVEGHLLGHRVGHLLRKHRPNPSEQTRQPVVLHQLRQHRHHALLRVIFIRHHPYPRALHRTKQN
mmetsp:Transcript_37329/g.76061  ORF Transcript_37329/g.76061 Transcript_37329/m.76061 type:complete len:216 (-) Transcript_37329:598-1245(-)